MQAPHRPRDTEIGARSARRVGCLHDIADRPFSSERQRSAMRSVPCLFHSALAVTWLLFAPAAGAETVIFAGPWGDPFAQSGYYNAEFFPLPPFRSAGDGVAAGYADRWIDGIYYGKRAVRWDASGSPPVPTAVPALLTPKATLFARPLLSVLRMPNSVAAVPEASQRTA